jgi:hypothetical protein
MRCVYRMHGVTVSLLQVPFVDIINCTDMHKDKNRIASLLESKALEIMKDEQQADKFAGWTIDSTRTNMKALQILSHERPKWINCGCIAHGLVLAMKDFCRCLKTHGCNIKTWGVQWIATVNDATNTMANYLNDSGPAKAMLHHYQNLWGKAEHLCQCSALPQTCLSCEASSA